jgi:hypothetical protein
MPQPQPKQSPKLPTTFSRLRALGDLKPQLRFGFAPGEAAGTLRLVLPLRRNWLVLLIVGLILGCFAAPLFGIARQLGGEGGDLFSLVANLFQLFWALGWSVGVGAIALLFLFLLLGREVVAVRPDSLLIRLEVLGFGLGGEYQAAGITNLRSAQPEAAVGTSWRGPHLAFDYYGVPVTFGSDLAGPRAVELLKLISVRLALAAGGIAPASGQRPVATPTPAFSTPPAEQTVPHPPQQGITELAAGLEAELSPLSTVALIIANLVPLAGVWLLGWDIGEIMLLYWAESGIIGLFNLLKMAMVGGWATLFFGPFFLGHYGGFMAVHLLFVYTFFVKGLHGGADISVSEVTGHFVALWPALLALTASHGISFVVNFLGRREYTETTIQKQMAEPYSRIIIMHLTIIFGGFVVMGLGSSLPALLLLMGAKIVVDLRAHQRQRK